MFIDYLTLMMFNLAAGLAMVAFWIHFDFDGPSARRWVPGFLMVGALALFTGLHMVLTWPFPPGAFNIVFGEPTLFFALLVLGLALTLWLGSDLLPVAVFATFVGFVAVLMAYQIWTLPLTKSPTMSSISFAVMGVIGLLSIPMYSMRNNANFRRIAVLGLAIGAVLWTISGAGSYLGHVEGSFQKWKPVHMGYQIEMNKPKQ